MSIYCKACLLIIAFLMMTTALTVQADELKVRLPNQNEIGKTVTCSVMKSEFKVDEKTPVIDYKGISYYFCCDSCVEQFKKDPDKFGGAEDMNVRRPTGSEIGKDVECPVTGSRFSVSRSTPVIDYKGKSYYFCCHHCAGEFKKDPAKYMAK